MVSVFKLLCLQIWVRKSGSLTIRAVPGSCSSITLADNQETTPMPLLGCQVCNQGCSLNISSTVHFHLCIDRYKV